MGWCEKKSEYGHFNTLGITAMQELDETYHRSRDSLFKEWQKLELLKLGKDSDKEGITL